MINLCVSQSGGVNTFVHALFTDFMAIVRAHTSALGGNAIVSYFMTRCDLSDLSKVGYGYY